MAISDPTAGKWVVLGSLAPFGSIRFYSTSQQATIPSRRLEQIVGCVESVEEGSCVYVTRHVLHVKARHAHACRAALNLSKMQRLIVLHKTAAIRMAQLFPMCHRNAILYRSLLLGFDGSSTACKVTRDRGCNKLYSWHICGLSFWVSPRLSPNAVVCR